MKKIIFLTGWCCCLFSCLLVSAQKTQSQRPSLVVGIVIDQMRWDYLYRYYDRYSAGGFKRLLNEGFSANNTHINYIPTVTAIGHASVFTGSIPSIHGIAGNDFIINETGKKVYCTEDNSVMALGGSDKAGKMSPRNMLTTTIGDELKLATNFKSRVYGVAIKDRGSILPAGHTANAAYWMDPATGDWISSTWYMKDLPEWVKVFNNKQSVKKYLQKEWKTLYHPKSYLQSSADDNRYEGKFKGMEHSVLPVHGSDLLANYGPGVIAKTPFGMSYTIDMALELIKNEKLGHNEATDFLTVSISSTDYIGHQFGPNSIEIEDTYLRLDLELESFFTYLDNSIGKGKYTIFLTADHGAAHNVEFMKDNKIPAGGWKINSMLSDLNKYLASVFNTDSLVLSMLYYQVHFNQDLIKRKNIDPEKLKTLSMQFLKSKEGVAYVVDVENSASASIPALLRERIINGFHHHRSGDIQVVLEPAWYYQYNNDPVTGTDHSSWNPNDSHIPFLLMGWGVKHGKTVRSTSITDIAPTICSILKIQSPNGCIGSAIEEALNN